jgi:protein-S-isoprenylcysteine O-methyltransferase Ste14
MDIRQLFFKLRSYTPIPLLVLLVVSARPTLPAFTWGLALILWGETLRMWAVAHAGGATRTRDVGAPQLVTSGPFARTRNPLYIANTIIYVGIACLAGGHLIWILFALGFSALQYSLIVSLEEETLAKLYGFEYEFYRRFVPRWMIRFVPWEWAVPCQPDWKDAWRNERHTRFNIYLSILVFSLIGIVRVHSFG